MARTEASAGSPCGCRAGLALLLRAAFRFRFRFFRADRFSRHHPAVAEFLFPQSRAEFKIWNTRPCDGGRGRLRRFFRFLDGIKIGHKE